MFQATTATYLSPSLSLNDVNDDELDHSEDKASAINNIYIFFFAIIDLPVMKLFRCDFFFFFHPQNVLMVNSAVKLK